METNCDQSGDDTCRYLTSARYGRVHNTLLVPWYSIHYWMALPHVAHRITPHCTLSVWPPASLAKGLPCIQYHQPITTHPEKATTQISQMTLLKAWAQVPITSLISGSKHNSSSLIRIYLTLHFCKQPWRDLSQNPHSTALQPALMCSLRGKGRLKPWISKWLMEGSREVTQLLSWHQIF
jgi:hypothetical protein